SAGRACDHQALEPILSGLSSRIFLMNNVHEDHPVVFESRWVMSYLRGPLTRAQIKSLMDPRQATPEAGASTEEKAAPSRPAKGKAASSVAAPAAAATAAPAAAARPRPPPDAPQHFVPPPGAPPWGSSLLYQPMLFGFAQVRVAD